MPSPDIQDQQKLVDQADNRMLECFEKITGDSLSDPKYLRFMSLLILWIEEYATLRRMQGDDGIRWARQAFDYHSAKIDTFDRIVATAAAKVATLDRIAADSTEEKS